MRILVQPTPNPNAYKFIVDQDLKEDGKVTITQKEACLMVPLAAALFDIIGVEQLHFFENTLTVTKSPHVPWDDMEIQVKNVLLAHEKTHDPTFEIVSEVKKKELTGPLREIDRILEETVRPYLQGDGGDIEVIDLSDHILTVHYEGACGTCPSAISGTLMAIQNILRDEFDPHLEVVTV